MKRVDENVVTVGSDTVYLPSMSFKTSLINVEKLRGLFSVTK